MSYLSQPANGARTIARQPSSIFNGASTGVHREVGHELQKRRRRHRQPGDVPYPPQCERDMLDFGVWDHMFFIQLHGGITLHKFKTPPARVLDLGCGAGTWVLSAAKQWKGSTFVGFDICRNQPDPKYFQPQDMSQRVAWVHGNFLDKLPFPDNEFDFVRIYSIGLGVPEDEWQDVMEDVVRILKPGGILEMMEEDLIFPCPNPPATRISKTSPNSARRGSEDTIVNTYRLDQQKSSGDSCGSEGSKLPLLGAEILSVPFHSNKDLDSKLSQDQLDSRRDHSMLKEAFTQMLSSRFINPQVLTVLPFYLQTAFHDVQGYSQLKIHLPPPSIDISHNQLPRNSNGQSSSPETLIDLVPVSPVVRRPSDAGDLLGSAITQSSAQASALTSSNARMHLTRTLRIITACKEAIWVEYEKLHRHDRQKPNTRLDREDFETYFWNWTCDMEDRIGMRLTLKSRLAWDEPQALERPNWQIWRDKEAESGFDISSLSSRTGRKDLCRSLRGFVCRKPTLPEPATGGGDADYVTTDTLEIT